MKRSAQGEAKLVIDRMDQIEVYGCDEPLMAEAQKFIIKQADEIEALQAELVEECRLNGMGSEREAQLITRNDKLIRECDYWKTKWDDGYTKQLEAERDLLVEVLEEAVAGMGGSFAIWEPKVRAALDKIKGTTCQKSK